MAYSVFSLTITTLFFLQLFSFSSPKPLVLPLKHALSKTLYKNTPHLLKSTTIHSSNRLDHHRNKNHHHHHRRHVSLPLTPGSDYTLSFSLGSQTISLYMDTGSDIVWLPCHPFTCILCEGKFDPATIPNPAPLNLTSATPVTCKSRACLSAHSSRSTSDLCAMAKCPLEDIETSDCGSFSCPPFYFAYADGSFVGNLYTDNLEIPASTPSLRLRNFTFGCAHTALAEPIGVAGFGRGALSMTTQLARVAPEIGNHFSYCLVSHSFDKTLVRKPSPLILGRYFSSEKVEGGGEESEDMVFTPMLENPKHPYFYCVGLEGVSVGRRRIDSPASLKRVDRKGNGGMVVDSGTTFTMLPKKFLELVVAEFRSRVGYFYKRAVEIEENTGLSPCYYIHDENVEKSVPQLVFHFGGNSSVVMPRKNYFYEFIDGGDDGRRKRKVGCFMVMDGGDEAESSGPAGLFGNYQQQGFEVVYDLEEKKLGFAKRKCSALWDSLNDKN